MGGLRTLELGTTAILEMEDLPAEDREAAAAALQDIHELMREVEDGE